MLVFSLRPGDEIRVAGDWLEIQSVRPVNSTTLIVKTYDPVRNVERLFSANPYIERRVRQPVEMAGA